MRLYNNTMADIELTELGVTVSAQDFQDVTHLTTTQLGNSNTLLTSLGTNSLQLEKSIGNYYQPTEALRVVSGVADPINGVDILTRYQFWSRFTFGEKLALHTSSSAYVQVVVKNLELAAYIDLHHPDLPPALDILVAEGIISTQRKTEILTIV